MIFVVQELKSFFFPTITFMPAVVQTGKSKSDFHLLKHMVRHQVLFEKKKQKQMFLEEPIKT